MLSPSGGIPNSRLPAVVLRGGLPQDARNGEAACAFLRGNGWPGTWVYGVYPFWHFHTRGHEVLACVSGWASLGLGGRDGIVARMEEGDACVLPAGVGHRCLEAGDGFLMAGGYPPGQEGNIVRPGDMTAQQIAREIDTLGLPATDPITGRADGIVALWKRAAAGTG
jgi:uncharacterized protein YjlB